jgi:hypothetical protein
MRLQLATEPGVLEVRSLAAALGRWNTKRYLWAPKEHGAEASNQSPTKTAMCLLKRFHLDVLSALRILDTSALSDQVSCGREHWDEMPRISPLYIRGSLLTRQ